MLKSLWTLRFLEITCRFSISINFSECSLVQVADYVLPRINWTMSLFDFNCKFNHCLGFLLWMSTKLDLSVKTNKIDRSANVGYYWWQDQSKYSKLTSRHNAQPMVIFQKLVFRSHVRFQNWIISEITRASRSEN